jgi:hypothetical protein
MKRKEFTASHHALDSATSALLDRAAKYTGPGGGNGVTSTQDLLRSAREYARALNRVETMRVKR